MTALAGGLSQHMLLQALTLGEAQVQVAGLPLHVGVAPPQTVVQLPQWLAVLSGVSHPGALVQSPYPALHEPTAQVPVAQVAVALAWLHSTPQPPQLAVVLVAVSQPSVSAVPPEQLA